MIKLASQVSVKCLIIAQEKLIIAQDKEIKTTSKDLCVTMRGTFILWISLENQVKFE